MKTLTTRRHSIGYFFTGLIVFLFTSNALAEDFVLTSSSLVSNSSQIIGSTVTFSVTYTGIASGNSPPTEIPVNLSVPGSPGINWVATSGPTCVPDGTPSTSIACPVPGVGQSFTYEFTSSEIATADNYTVNVDSSDPNCPTAPSGSCITSQSFDIYAPTVTLSLVGGGTSVTEGDSGTSNANLQATLSEAPAGSASSFLNLILVSPSGPLTPASQGSDYNFASIGITWASVGALTQPIPIPIVGDTIMEPSEGVFIGPSVIQGINTIGSTTSFTLTILDNDAPAPTPEVSLSAPFSVDEDNGPLVATVTIDSLPPGSAAVDVVTSFTTSSTAADGSDITSTSVSIDYDASGALPGAGYTVVNPTTVIVNVGITNDSLVEGPEDFLVSLTDNVNLNINSSASQSNITIEDDDVITPLISVSVASSVDENNGPLIATVIIDSLPNVPASAIFIADVTSNSGDATSADFTAVIESINYTPSGAVPSSAYTVVNPTTIEIPIPITDDSLQESSEDFIINITDEINLVLDSSAIGTLVTIVDDDSTSTNPTPPTNPAGPSTPAAPSGPATISVSTQRSFQENSGRALITFTRSGNTSDAVSFDFQTVDIFAAVKAQSASTGIATAGADYTSTSTTVSWAAGEGGDKSVAIPIIDDSLFEGDETFSAQASDLSSGAQFSFAPNLTITIVEDDAEPAGEFNFSAAAYNIAEDGGSATITVSRSGGSSGTASVNYASSDGSATAPSDYVSSAGTLTWADGDSADKTFTIDVNEDITNEPTETVDLELSNPSLGASLGGLANSVLNISNVNAPGAPEISKDDISVTDFDGDGLVDVVLDATGKIISDKPIEDISWVKDGSPIASGMVTSAKLPLGVHPLKVIATDSSGKRAAVDFVAEVLKLDDATTRALSETPGLNTEQGTVAGALDNLCPRLSELGQQASLSTGQSNLRQRCENLRDPDLEDGDIVQALDQIAGEEAEAIIITAARFTNMHHTNLRNRFTQLRRGGTSIIDVSGLNLRLDGGSLNGNMFVDAGREILGGAASADAPEAQIITDSRLGLFVNGNVSYGERDPSKNNSGFKLDIQGITAGMDYRFTDSFIGGVAVGYSSSDLDYANDAGILEGSSTFYSAYTSYYNASNYYIDTSITYADSDFGVTRHIKYRDASGLVDLRRSGGTDGDQTLATLDFGWDYNNGPWTFGPNGSLSYSETSIDGYAERGDSGLELMYSGQDNVTSTLGIGFHGSRVFLMGWGVLIANVNGDYYREFKNQNGIMRARFVHDPFRLDDNNPTGDMLIISDIPDRNYFSVGVGLAAQFAYGLSGFVDYQTLLATDDIELGEFSFGLRYEAKF